MRLHATAMGCAATPGPSTMVPASTGGTPAPSAEIARR